MSIPDTYRTPHGLTDDLRAGIAGTGSLVLGTINPDGSPHLTLVLFAMSGADVIDIPTPHTTRKIKNVRDRPAVTCLFRIPSGWVSCYGDAAVLEGAEAAAANQAVRERLLTDEGLQTMGRFLASHEDTTIRVTPTRWLSWVYDPIDEWMKAEGIDTSNEDEWWKDLSGDQH